MTLVARSYGPHLLAAIALLTSAACSDRATTLPDPRQIVPTTQAARTISDGAHGGNPEVFFLPPMVGNPNGAASFNDAFQSGLPVSVVITDQTPGNSFAPLTVPMQPDASNSFYQANWDTQAVPLNLNDSYRINVMVGSKTIAFADVALGSNGGTLKNVDTQSFIGLVNGRTLPIKVRINKGWNCVNRGSCVTQVVPNPVPPGQTIIIVSNDSLNSAAFTGTWAGTVPFVVVTLEDVTNQLSVANGGPGCSLGVTSMLSREHCVRITADPSVILTAPVQVGTCISTPLGDLRQLLLKYDFKEAPHFLSDGTPPHPCPAGFAMAKPSSNPFVRLASAAFGRIGQGLGWAMGLKPAYAFDVGVGGTIGTGDGFSILAPGFPAQMSIVGGNGQIGGVSSVLQTAATVQVSALHDVGPGELPAAVTGEHLTCTALTSGAAVQNGDGFATSAPAVDNGDGTYTCPAFQLSATAGANMFRVTASNLDRNVVLEAVDGEETSDAGTVTFSETGVAGPFISNLTIGSNSLVIDGPNTNFTAQLTNPTNTNFENVTLQGYVVQGPTRRSATIGISLQCNPNETANELPPGAPACTVQTTLAVSDQLLDNGVGNGTGTFSPGAATFELDLLQQPAVGGPIVTLDTKTLPITLQSQPIIP